MKMQLGLVVVGAFISAALVGQSDAQKTVRKSVDLTMIRYGSLTGTVPKDIPNAITSEMGLKKLWTDWGIRGSLPKVDFAKNLVVVAATDRGEIRTKLASFDPVKGDLQFGFGASPETKPGFRYFLASVPRAGVKTVNEKELPGN